ncbi:MAG: hypothetical protein GXO70_00540 [Acidobacteria bacterium]|nr:hypothetical protein [Acidobacteriota bacterium]
MWKALLKFQRRSKLTLWKFSAPILIFLTIANGGWTQVDRLALVVGNRPVTLSEVRAWVYLQSGECLSEPLKTADRKQINRMIAAEKLYQVGTQFGKFKFQPQALRQALRVVDSNRGFRLLDSGYLQRCHISLPLLEEVLRRELVVQHYIRSRSGSVKPGADTLTVLASGLKPDVLVVNLLFQENPAKNTSDSGPLQSEKH